MRVLIFLLLLCFTSEVSAQRTRPSMIIDSTMLAAMKQRARDNTDTWKTLYGGITSANIFSCQWATQYTSSTSDNLPPVYAYRETRTNTATGYVITGSGGNYYQGAEAAHVLLNLSVCYLTLKDGDVDVAGSTEGTSDEVALATKYGTQAMKILDKFTTPYAKLSTTTPPDKWMGLSWIPVNYVDKSATDTTGCSVSGEYRVTAYTFYHGLTAGSSVTLTGITGGLSTLNGNAYVVSSNGLTSSSFQLVDGSGNAICSSSSGTNYNALWYNDDLYPIRFGMPLPSLAYDWLYNHASMTSALKTQVADSMEAWYRASLMLYSNSSGHATYELNTQCNYHWGVFNSHGMAGISLNGDDARADVWYNHWRNIMLLGRDQPFISRWMGNDGSFMEAYQYYTYSIEMMILTVVSAEMSLGDTLINHATQPLSTFLEGQLSYIKQSLQPNAHSILQRNTTGYTTSASSVPFESNRIVPSALYILSWLADRENYANKDKFRQLVNSAREYTLAATGYPITRDDTQWITFLFWDPTGTMTAWSDAVLSTCGGSNPAGGCNHAFMRSDWTTSAVYGSLAGGPFTSDLYNGKESFDRGALQVQRGDIHLLVNPKGECFRNLPASYAGNEVQAAAAIACYNTIGAIDSAGIGRTTHSMYYLMKPGQAEGNYRYYVQSAKPTADGVNTYSPWTPGSDVPPNQELTGTWDADTDTFTATAISTGNHVSTGNVAYITYGDGLIEGAAPGGLARGTKYYVRALSGSTFKLATTNSDSTIVDITSAGSGTQYVMTGLGPDTQSKYLTFTHPTRIDRFSTAAAYSYARATSLHKLYVSDSTYTSYYPLTNWQRDVLYVRPNLFVVHDLTTKVPKTSGTSRNISSVSDTTPVMITTTAAHGYHTGMTVTVANSTVSAINGTWPITLVTPASSTTSATQFTLDGSTASGAGGTAGTVTGTILYQPTMAWTTGKTPVVDGSNSFRYVVSDGSTYKGAITTILPTSATLSVRNISNYGMIYQIQVADAMATDSTNWLTVVDAGATAENTSNISGTGVDAVLVGTTAVGFVTASLPISYTAPTAIGHIIAGLTPSTTYYMTGTPLGVYTVDSTGSTGAVISDSAGVIYLANGPSTLGVITQTLPSGVVGTAYSQALTAGGGASPYTWSLSSGSLPAGLSLATGGTISGTPTSTGTFTFVVLVTDADSNTSPGSLTISIGPALSIITSSLVGGTVGTAYSAIVSASGGVSPYTWTIQSGSIPTGMSFSSLGELSGTPTVAGTFIFTVRVTDSATVIQDKELSVTIGAAPVGASAEVLGSSTVTNTTLP